MPSAATLFHMEHLDGRVDTCIYALVADRRLYSFWIDEKLVAGLKRVKTQVGISESEQIRRAITGWLRARDVKRPTSPRVRRLKPKT